MGWLWFILIGLVAGWLAGKIMRGGGFGLLMNIIVGIIGALLGGWVFDKLNIEIGSGLIGSVVTALVGAILLLWLISLFKKKS
ncbi:MAG: GlsB/YeaQ/YmgE family stress response membrane protein [Dysgonamonadaceae bacterium]